MLPTLAYSRLRNSLNSQCYEFCHIVHTLKPFQDYSFEKERSNVCTTTRDAVQTNWSGKCQGNIMKHLNVRARPGTQITVNFSCCLPLQCVCKLSSLYQYQLSSMTKYPVLITESSQSFESQVTGSYFIKYKAFVFQKMLCGIYKCPSATLSSLSMMVI